MDIKNSFLELDEGFHKFVKLGDNSNIGVRRKGCIELQVNNVFQVITEVFYVVELKNNLLNIGHLKEKGLTIIFRDN